MDPTVEVDPRRCIATKACMHAAEGVFAIVGGVSTVVDATAATEEDLLLAAEACPVGAIKVLRDEDRIA